MLGKSMLINSMSGLHKSSRLGTFSWELRVEGKMEVPIYGYWRGLLIFNYCGET